MIGVYDSGFGGLSVLRQLRRRLPLRDFTYLGDSGRGPYGGRDHDTVLDFSEQAVERLFEEGCRLIVVACHTVSCVALRHLQQRYAGPDAHRRILGVTIPAAEVAVRTSRGHIGVLATTRTVHSHTYEAEIAKLGSHRVSQIAAPLLAPIVEEGLQDSEIAHLAATHYVAGFQDIDTLVLGCTHYPFLLDVLTRTVAPGVQILDPAPFVADALSGWLDRHPRFDDEGTGALRVLCTGDPVRFSRLGAPFLGEGLPEVLHVAERDGRLSHANRADVPRGQVVRTET